MIGTLTKNTRLVSLILFVGVLSFYVYTLQPSLSWGDGTRIQREAVTGESFILAELVSVPFAPDPFPFARLGVAAWDHPLYVMITHTMVSLFPTIDRLWLVNLHSAVFGAAAIAVFYALCFAHTRSAAASLLASLALAASHTFWFHAVTPEVYSLHALLLLLAVYGFDAYEKTQNGAALAAGAMALGLAAANHLLAFVALPALAIYWWLRRRERPAPEQGGQNKNRRRHWTAFAFVIGFSPYLIQFARMLRTFPLAQVMGPVVGETFLQGLLRTSPAQWGGSVIMYFVFLLLQFNPLGVAAGAVGFWKGAERYSALWRKALALYLAYTAFGVLYRVSDQFAFLLSSHIFFAAAIAMGLGLLMSKVTGAKKNLLVGAFSAGALAMPFLYGALPGALRAWGMDDATFGIPKIGSGYRDGLNFYINPDKRGDDSPYRFGRETMTALPPRALVLAEYYIDTDEYFVLRYFAAVEGLRPDVEIVGWPLENIAAFDASLAVSKIAAELPVRAVYLASLDERFYSASALAAKYCIVPEHNLYRVYADRDSGSSPAGFPCINLPASGGT